MVLYILGIPLTLHGGRPSSRLSQRSSAGTLNYALKRKSSSSDYGHSSLIPASRTGVARAAAILLISCQGQNNETNGKNHRRTLSDVVEGSSDELGRIKKTKKTK